jgi:two-component system sensor histidine kinase/response regulator
MKHDCSKKILIVDDEADNLQLIVESIEQMGSCYNILLANSVFKAIQIIKRNLPDLIITDWEMPSVDGLDLIRMVQDDPEIRHIPILMCTGVMVSADHLKAALEAGAVDYIRKPFDKIELNARLNSMMKLSESTKKIRDLNEKKERILSIVAHDLRGPLGAIKYLANVTLEGHPNRKGDELYDTLAQIEEQVSVSYDLLNNLLLWIKLPGEGSFYHPKLQKISVVLDDCITFARTTINSESVNLVMDTDDSLAYFDRELISSAIRNLISNAIKNSPKGSSVRVSTVRNDSYVSISVQDEGVGMDAATIEKILNSDGKYERNSSSKGWGIGLKLVKQILELHQTSLIVESELGKGSNFTFKLPCAGA